MKIPPIIEQFLIGAGITAVITLGANMANLGPAEDLQTWGRNLFIAEVTALGSFIVGFFRGKGATTIEGEG